MSKDGFEKIHCCLDVFGVVCTRMVVRVTGLR